MIQRNRRELRYIERGSAYAAVVLAATFAQLQSFTGEWCEIIPRSAVAVFAPLIDSYAVSRGSRDTVLRPRFN